MGGEEGPAEGGPDLQNKQPPEGTTGEENLRAELAASRAEAEKLRTQVGKHEAKMAKWKSKVEENHKKDANSMSDLKQRLQSAEARAKEWQSKFEEQKQGAEAAAPAGPSSRETELEEALQSAKQELAAATEKLATHEQMALTFSKEADKLRASLKQSQEESDRQLQQISRGEKREEELQEEISKLQEAAGAVQREYEEKIEEERSKAESAQGKALEESQSQQELLEKIASLERQVGVWQMRDRNNEEENHRRREEWAAARETLDQDRKEMELQANSSRASYEAKISILEDSISRMTDQMREREETYEEMECQRQELLNKAQYHESNSNALSQRCADLTAANHRLAASVEEAKDLSAQTRGEIEVLKLRSAEAEEEVDKQLSESRAARDAQAAAELRNTHLQADLQRMEQRVELLQKQAREPAEPPRPGAGEGPSGARSSQFRAHSPVRPPPGVRVPVPIPDPVTPTSAPPFYRQLGLHKQRNMIWIAVFAITLWSFVSINSSGTTAPGELEVPIGQISERAREAAKLEIDLLRCTTRLSSLEARATGGDGPGGGAKAANDAVSSTPKAAPPEPKAN